MKPSGDPSRSGERALFRATVRLAAAAGAALGVVEATLWLAHEVVLKSFYVQDRLGPLSVLRDLVDPTVPARALLLYGALGAVSGGLAGGLAVLAARREERDPAAGPRPRAVAMLVCLGAFAAAELALVRRGAMGALWPPSAIGVADVAVAALLVAAAAGVHGPMARALERRRARRGDRGRTPWLRGALVAVLAFPVAAGLALAALAGVGGASPRAERSAASGAPSVLLIVLDTARADRFSAYGYARPTSPALDALAARGVLYERAWSPAPWTLPAHGSLFTGELPHRHGAHWGPLRLDPDIETLAERFREAGYRTAAFTNNPWIGSVSGLDRGFDEVHAQWRSHGGAWDRLLAVRALRRATGRRHDEGARATVAAVERWLAESGEGPCFLFVNLMEPHDPNWPAPEAERFLPPGTPRARLRSLNQNPYEWFAGVVDMTEEDFALLSDLYDAQIAYVDRFMGELASAFEAARGASASIVAVVGDHGEHLGEHGAMSHVFSLGEPLLHVPLVVAGAGVPVGRRETAPVSTVDLAPTLERLARLAPAGREGRAGRDLLAGDLDPRRVLVAENYRPGAILDILERIAATHSVEIDRERFDRSLVAVRQGDLKLVSASDGSVSLYDLASDPRELRNLAPERPEEVQHLRSRATESLDAVHGARPVATPLAGDLDEATRERLKELGYTF